MIGSNKLSRPVEYRHRRGAHSCEEPSDEDALSPCVAKVAAVVSTPAAPDVAWVLSVADKSSGSKGTSGGAGGGETGIPWSEACASLTGDPTDTTSSTGARLSDGCIRCCMALEARETLDGVGDKSTPPPRWEVDGGVPAWLACAWNRVGDVQTEPEKIGGNRGGVISAAIEDELTPDKTDSPNWPPCDGNAVVSDGSDALGLPTSEPMWKTAAFDP